MRQRVSRKGLLYEWGTEKSSMKDHRRKAIINAAFQIFVEKKIEPVSMGEIAELAGVGRATLFRYYPNKLELVIAVCAC